MALTFIGEWPDQAEQESIAQTMAFLEQKPEAWTVKRCSRCGHGYILALPGSSIPMMHADSVAVLRMGALLYYQLGVAGMRRLVPSGGMPLTKTA